MRRRDALVYSLTSTILLGACAEQPSAPSLTAMRSTASARGDVGCVATDLVATNEAQLNALIAASQPGDVIAVSGMVSMSDAVRPRANTTITCAAPGDGIAASAAFTYPYLIEVTEPDVTIQGLRVIPAGVEWPIFVTRTSFEDENGTIVHYNGNDARVVGNSVTCSPTGCTFFVGAANGVVADNEFTAPGSTSGIHIQGAGPQFRTDGMKVLRNRIVATANAGIPSFGAIRPRDGSNMIVSENSIVGPWSNGIATTQTLDATFERNTVEGARRYGVFVGSANVQGVGAVAVRGLLVRNNILTGAENAIRVNGACKNVFVANKLSSASGIPVFFTATTGANNLLGGDNSVNVDNGAFDCDGDGDIDPNFLTGRKRAGTQPGETMQAVMPPSGRGAAMH